MNFKTPSRSCPHPERVATLQKSHRRESTTVYKNADTHPLYQRAKDLPRLIKVTDEVLRSSSRANRMIIIGLIENALRKERLCAQNSASLYRVEKHQMLLHALKTERGKLTPPTFAKEQPVASEFHRRQPNKKRHLLLRDSVFKNVGTK